MAKAGLDFAKAAMAPSASLSGAASSVTMSSSSTEQPADATCAAIPDPITPEPSTPIFLMTMSNLPSRCPVVGSNLFDDGRNALAAADAHGGDAVLSTVGFEAAEQGGEDAGAAGAQRVPDGDGTAPGVHLGGVVAAGADHSKALRGEGFVQF